jgi:hypothetical protein
MDAALLLLLVCCWNLTEANHRSESDVTGEPLSSAMDFLTPTTSDQNTLYTSFSKTNAVTDPATIEQSDVTTVFTGTEVARYEHEKTDLKYFKETNTLRVFIEKQHVDLDLLNKKINNLEKEVGKTIWKFINENDESVRHLALNQTMQYEEALVEYVNRSNELNSFIDNQNSSAEDELKVTNMRKVENDLKSLPNIKHQLYHLFALVDLNAKYDALTDLVLEKRAQYRQTLEMSVLEEIVSTLKEITLHLNEHLREAKALLNFTKTFNLKRVFVSKFTDQLVDLELWESELKNRKGDLTDYENVLKDEKFRHLLERYINPAMQSVIFITGLLGNGVLLLIFAMHRDMRTAPNLMVLNLSLGDLLSLISNILLYDVVDVVGVWPYGLVPCIAYRFVRHLCLGVTVYSIVVISAQRFFALTAFFNWRGFGCRLMKNYKSLLVIASVWLIASAIAMPRTVNAGIFNNKCLGYGLKDSDQYYRLVNSIDFVTLCVVPLAIITVLSEMTARRIKNSIKDMPGENAGKEKMKQARILSSNILIALAVVFALCYVPYFTYSFLITWFKLNVDNSTHHLISFSTFSLIFANACFNPIAVYLASRKYRIYMNKYLLCKCRDRVGRNISTEASTTVQTQI